MPHSNAWILDFGMDFCAAVGVREILHLVDDSPSFAIPCTPLFCHRVIIWQGNLLPLMDLAARGGLDAKRPNSMLGRFPPERKHLSGEHGLR